ncbi:MAG: response regulator transcription factor [Acidobacteriota bacterium]
MMKVLIVDDNAEMRRLLCSLVNRLAEAVYECEDGAQAVETYAAQHLTAADWVLMDIEMPHLNGLQATRELKHRWPDARVCIVTGYSQPEWREAARAAGASGYVLKEQLHTVRHILQTT